MWLYRRSIPKREVRLGQSDYVYQNALATNIASVNAKSRRHTDGDGEGEKWLQKESFGRVPLYLQTRKAELARKHAEEQVSIINRNRHVLLFCRAARAIANNVLKELGFALPIPDGLQRLISPPTCLPPPDINLQIYNLSMLWSISSP